MSCVICCWRASISGDGERGSVDGPARPGVCAFFGAISFFGFLCVVCFVCVALCAGEGLRVSLLCVCGSQGRWNLCFVGGCCLRVVSLPYWLSSPRRFLAGLFVGL